MPRGFLVKRRDYFPYSYRQRNNSEEAAPCIVAENGCENDYSVYKNLGSPDSGYGHSPTSLTFRDNVFDGESSGCSSPSSPKSTTISPVYGTPFFTNFGRLTLCSPLQTLKNTDNQQSAPSSPKKRQHNEPSENQKSRSSKKPKAARKLNFDEVQDLTSPVSGTVIRPLSCDSDDEGHVSGDIDSSLNWVDISPEARAELEKIDNKIGDYVCMLCKEYHEDAFQLAQHRCSRIVYVEYRCPECDKVFNCPANLASHRRWHKPRPAGNKPSNTRPILPSKGTNEENQRASPVGFAKYECETCGRKFKRQAYLRKHQSKHDAVRPISPASKTPNLSISLSSDSGPDNYRCPQCNITFPNDILFEKHCQLLHAESKLFDCKYCAESFPNSLNLEKHINKFHHSANPPVIFIPTSTQRTG